MVLTFNLAAVNKAYHKARPKMNICATTMAVGDIPKNKLTIPMNSGYAGGCPPQDGMHSAVRGSDSEKQKLLKRFSANRM